MKQRVFSVSYLLIFANNIYYRNLKGKIGMVVFTAKLTRRKAAAGIVALCLILSAFVASVAGGGEDNFVSVSDEAQISVAERKIKTNEERVALLRECGWQVDEEPIEFIEVKIPREFDGVYNDYNDIQKRQGMDLSKFSGKRVMRYTYKVNNYRNEDSVVANLIVYRDKLIGGDVSSPKLGGFMHGILENSEKKAE